MPYIYLVLSTFFVASSGILATFFNNKTNTNKSSTEFYNLIISISIFLSWAIFYIFDYSFNAKVIIYSIAFFIFFSSTFIFQLKAIQTGPMSLTSLMLQFSLIGVTIYGIVFGWPNTELTYLIVIGLFLVAISLFLCLYEGKSSKGLKINIRWLFYALMMFLSNTTCSVLQKEQQIAFNGQHGSMFMVTATFLFFIYALFVYFKSDKTDYRQNSEAVAFPIFSGVFNFGLNFSVIMLAQQDVLSPSVIYLVIAVGGLILSTVFATVVFKEKLAWWQWMGIIIGIVAVAMLNV